MLVSMDAIQENTNLYPALQPYRSGKMDVGDGHSLYWEQSGNPDGVPVIFLHGGPGAGCCPSHRRFFDPRHYWITLFDQRGCGRSTPYACIENNTTGHLIDDIEALRTYLKIDNWLVFGGSWGSTLALAYGIEYPEHCRGFVLRGVYLATAAELDWFIHGIANIFPQAHRDLIEFLPENEQSDIIASYHQRLIHPDPKVHMPAAASWSRYEALCSTLLPSSTSHIPPPKRDIVPASGGGGLAISRLETHYFINHMFIDENFILNNLNKLSGLLAIIIQGRYDIICPVISADKLARHWPGGDSAVSINIIENAGHSAMEPGIRSALVQATDSLRGEIRHP
jgi:proline iminopeptidase